MKKALKRISNEITGDRSKIEGDVSGIRGDVSGVEGNIDDCELTDEERKEGININELVADDC